MSRFKVGDKAKCGVSEVTILGVASNGMYACEYDNGAVGFLNPPDLMPPEPEQVVRWVYLWSGGETTTNSGDKPCFYRGYTLGDNALVARARVVLKPGQFDDETDPYTKGWNEALDAACSRFGDWPTPGSVNQSVKDECIGLIRALKRSAP